MYGSTLSGVEIPLKQRIAAQRVLVDGSPENLVVRYGLPFWPRTVEMRYDVVTVFAFFPRSKALALNGPYLTSTKIKAIVAICHQLR